MARIAVTTYSRIVKMNIALAHQRVQKVAAAQASPAIATAKNSLDSVNRMAVGSDRQSILDPSLTKRFVTEKCGRLGGEFPNDPNDRQQRERAKADPTKLRCLLG